MQHATHDDAAVTMTVEQAGKLLGISRRSAYRAAASGDIPTIRLGHRILVPTARLHRMLGLNEDISSAVDTRGVGAPRDRRSADGDGAGGAGFSTTAKR